jgi:transcriptional regulator with XRE-family HTH domain
VHDDVNSLGTIIKEARIKKGITQEALAEKVGVGSRHLMGIENEGSHPSYTLLYHLIRELCIQPDVIFFPEKHTDVSNISDLVYMLENCDDRALVIIRATITAALESSPQS